MNVDQMENDSQPKLEAWHLDETHKANRHAQQFRVFSMGDSSLPSNKNNKETATPADIKTRSFVAATRHTSKLSLNATCQKNRHKGVFERTLISLILPLIFVFLLPTIRLDSEQQQQQENLWTSADTSEVLRQLVHKTEQTTSTFLLALLRLPLDRIRLEASGLMLSASAKEINTKADLQEEETQMLMLAPAEHRASYATAPATHSHYHYGGEQATGAGPQLEAQAPAGAEYGSAGEMVGGDHVSVAPAPEATIVSESAGQSGALQARSDLPAVRALNVKCEKNHMTVNIVFDRPFYGMVFSKGHYNDQKCVHLAPNSGQTSINFDIHLGKCGMSSSDAGLASGGVNGGVGGGGTSALQANAASGQQPNGVYIENTIIIQYDPLVQEIYDQARKLRCTWYDYYEKSVTFRPYNVDMLDAVTANFLGDNIQCWMQIQVGKGPWSSEVAGIVKIGQTMTMVLAIKDDENRFDMLVRNCVAHNGKHQPIQLVDEYGCVARPKIMGKFQKVRNFGPAATVVSYAHFQAFKFPDSMSVHFQCVIQVCRYECPEPACNQPSELASASGSSSSLAGPQAPAVNQGDYATSGTEMVASKEQLPGHHHGPSGYFGSGGGLPLNTIYANHSQHSGATTQNVQLKLDESQGRVQVKLDTSMMAGRLTPGHQANSGPLPPHLLHAAAATGPSEQAASGRNYLSSSYYRPQTTVGGHTTLSGASANGLPVVRAAPTPSSGNSAIHQQQIVNYSPQYGGSSAAAAASRRAAFANRLGDLTTQQTGESVIHHQLAPPYEAAEYPLSLIASPRGLKLSSGNGELATRFKREALDDERLNGSSRQARHKLKARSGGDSTSVETHKTIQVVSSDDVAFSLLEPIGELTSARSIKTQPISSPSLCFSPARFLLGALVTLAVLASSIVTVAYVILRQRSQLKAKLASVFVDSSSEHDYSATPHPMSHTPPHALDIHQQILGSTRSPQLNRSTAAAYCQAQTATTQHISQRQHDELQQRNNYLSRLYSQFAPANYWR